MKDILQAADGDLDFSSGDLQINESTEQHVRDLLLLDKGQLKETPAAGIGAIDYLHDSNPDDFLRVVRQELGRDGMKVEEVCMQGGELKITGEYENS